MDTKVKGIVIKTSEYKEADKLASIFTLEQGKIFVKFAGVKKDKAKLKSIAQPFVLAEFNISTKGKNNTITSANLIDDFSSLLNNYKKMMCGYIILDIIKSILPSEKSEPDLFLILLACLKNIEQNDEYIYTIDFILKFIEFSGMGLKFYDSTKIYLDKTTGDFNTVKDINSIEIDKRVYTIIKNINEQNYSFEYNQTTIKQALRLLHNILYAKFNEDIKSFEFI